MDDSVFEEKITRLRTLIFEIELRGLVSAMQHKDEVSSLAKLVTNEALVRLKSSGAVHG